MLLGQVVSLTPAESANWLRLARAVMQVRVANDPERAVLLERAATAAYIAYQRAGNRNEEADSLLIIGRSHADRGVWRPALDALRLALELRETADVRALYEKMREDHGFRMLDYSVDSDAASPRACFQFSEALPGKRADFSPFVAVAGLDKPALSAEDKQLCVEGLRHGERYSVTLRAGLPSTVKETLGKVRRTHDLRARPQAVRALCRQGLCAAAASASAASRWSASTPTRSISRSTASATAI